jgi:hypothetical protein
VKTFRLADAMNTYNPALNILKDKGYLLWLDPGDEDDDDEDWWASKDGREFVAADPLRLLALVAIWEALGDAWRISDKRVPLYNEIRERAYAPRTDE